MESMRWIIAVVILLPLATAQYWGVAIGSEEEEQELGVAPTQRGFYIHPNYARRYYEDEPQEEPIAWVRRELRDGKKKYKSKSKKKGGGGGGWGEPEVKWVGWGWDKKQIITLPGPHFQDEKGPLINIHPKPVHTHGWGKEKKGWGHGGGGGGGGGHSVGGWGHGGGGGGGHGGWGHGKIIHAYEGWQKKGWGHGGGGGGGGGGGFDDIGDYDDDY